MGLYATSNLTAQNPDWELVESYKFHHPMRVRFSDGYLYVVSFGAGVMRGELPTTTGGYTFPEFDPNEIKGLLIELLNNPPGVQLEPHGFDKYEYHVTNVKGVVFAQGSGSAKGRRVHIDTAEFPPGLYVVKVQDAAGKSAVKKFVVAQ